ncbi:MAG: hypothetical protein K1X79_12285 [Oligoflexia bacterium]|nr:hypothetical protein [Oligoflexia bacterium]
MSSMKLTRIQQKFIDSVSRQRGVDVRLLRKLLSRAPRWILLALTSGAAALAFWHSQLQPMSFVLLGFWFGGVLADVGWALTGHRLWPVIHEITDWQKVDQLVQTKK